VTTASGREARPPGAALFFAALLVYACEVSSGRKQCAQTCAAGGAADFIYVPGDSRSAREAECICGDPSPAAPVGS